MGTFITKAGVYDVDVLHLGQNILTCTGGDDAVCQELEDKPTLVIVHGDLLPPSSLATDVLHCRDTFPFRGPVPGEIINRSPFEAF
jgi:hypothetical protein